MYGFGSLFGLQTGEKILRSKSVSYTHLDVYKRQDHDGCGNRGVERVDLTVHR